MVHREHLAEDIVLPVAGLALQVVDFLACADHTPVNRVEHHARIVVLESVEILLEAYVLVRSHGLDTLHRLLQTELSLVSDLRLADLTLLCLEKDDTVGSSRTVDGH